jgi:alpha-L-rhamnosidase
MAICWRAILAFCLSLSSTSALAQTADPNAAQWIAPADPKGSASGVFHFRRDLTLDAKPSKMTVQVSADQRYRLFVNGKEVSNGPARGDLLHWHYEDVDLAPYLNAGHNVIAALVWNFGEHRPAAQVSSRTAFLLQAHDAAQGAVNSNAQWRVLASDAYHFLPVVGLDSGGYYVAGPNEHLDAALYPWDWLNADADIKAWPSARPIGPPTMRAKGGFGLAKDWQLVARTIPPMEQTPVRYAAVRRADGVAIPPTFLAGKAALSIPANSKVTFLLDQGTLTMGYPVMRVSGGRGAKMTMTYAEALFDADGNKGNRNDVEGKNMRGVRDFFTFDGGENRQFQSLWLRAFRYVEVEIETGEDPLTIHDMSSIFSAYPFTMQANFAGDAPWIKPIWDLNWRALRLSAFETFWDTPYYEQLQYVGDTRIESILSVYLTGDDRLMRNAITQFRQSQIPDGITRSAYPSADPQFIPSFSLWWVAMVHDHWMMRGDADFVRKQLPATRSVLSWFDDKVDETGMVGPLGWWPFLDWATEFEAGNPPDAANGHVTAFTLQYAIVLRQAAEMELAIGNVALATQYDARADKLVAAARQHSFRPERGLFADSMAGDNFSQQTNTLAILAGAFNPEEQQAAMQHILTDKDLVKASFYFQFYVHEALRTVGMADAYLDQLGPWQTMLDNGMTATAETPEPTRSDSHAWSAHPNYHLLATVLGLRPASPGFQTVMVEPALGKLQWANGAIPHSKGTISVQLRRVGPSGISARVTLPSGISGRFHWAGQDVALSGGENEITCRPQCRKTGR